MVQTTSGPADTGTMSRKSGHETAKTDGTARSVRGGLDLDDQTWNAISAQAQSQNRETSDVIRAALEQQFGKDTPVATHHNGNDWDENDR